MGMVTDAVNQGLNTYYTMSDRNRRTQMDEQERARYEQQMARQAQLDEERRQSQEQQSNFQSQNQMMNSQNFENQQNTYQQQQDEYDRGLGLRQKQEAAGERSMSVPDDYSGQDFAPIEGDQGLRKRGMVSSRPEYLKSMQESDPANAPKYGDELSKLHDEGVIKAALLLKQNRPQEAAQAFNSSGGERLGPRGFFKDPKTGGWMAEESDGIAAFDPDKTIEYAQQSSGKQEKPMILNYGDKAFMGREMIAENPREQGGGSGGGDGGGMASMKPDIYTLKDGRPVSGKYLQDVWEASNTITNEFGQKQMKPNAEPPELWIRKNFGIDITGGGMQQQPQSSQSQQESLPPAQAHAGRVVRDTATGERYQSNGRTWVRMGGKSGSEQPQFPEYGGGLAAPR